MSQCAEVRRLLAVDPSLRSSGWALFSLSSGEISRTGIIGSFSTKLPIPQRLEVFQRQVEQLLLELHFGSGDFLVCEGPAPLVLNPQSALKVERVRGIFESVARSLGVCVPGRLNPRTVQTELLGMRGPQLSRAAVKDWARETALRLYGESLIRASGTPRSRLSQDIVDAALVGTLALARIQLALRSGQEMYTVFSSRPGWSERWLKTAGR